MNGRVRNMEETIGHVRVMPKNTNLVPENHTIMEGLPTTFTDEEDPMIGPMKKYLVDSLQEAFKAAIPKIIEARCKDLEDKKDGYASLSNQIDSLINKLQPNSNPVKIEPKVDPPSQVQKPFKPPNLEAIQDRLTDLTKLVEAMKNCLECSKNRLPTTSTTSPQV